MWRWWIGNNVTRFAHLKSFYCILKYFTWINYWNYFFILDLFLFQTYVRLMTQFVEMDPASMKPVAITVHALQALLTTATKRVVVLVRIDFFSFWKTNTYRFRVYTKQITFNYFQTLNYCFIFLELHCGFFKDMNNLTEVNSQHESFFLFQNLVFL